MPETPIHKLRYPVPSDPATLADYYQQLAEDTERELEDIAPDQLADGSTGQLLVVQSTGAPAYKALSGDATIAESGALTIGAGKVSTSKIADKAVTAAKIDNGTITADKLVELVAQALIPTGAVLATARSTASTGFLFCEGQAVSRTTYSALFSAIGTTYGAGDGSTTFNLPDYRGRSLYGKGTHVDVNALSDTEGLAVGSRRARHAHEFGGATGAPTSGFFEVPTGGPPNTLVNNAHVHNVFGTTDERTGGYAVVNWMIKL